MFQFGNGANDAGHTAMFVGNKTFAQASGPQGRPGGGGQYHYWYDMGWQDVLRPFSLYIKKWQPSDRTNDGWEKP